MKQIVASRLVEIPDDIKFEIKARKVRVKGPRGEMPCSFTFCMKAFLFCWFLGNISNTFEGLHEKQPVTQKLCNQSYDVHRP